MSSHFLEASEWVKCSCKWMTMQTSLNLRWSVELQTIGAEVFDWMSDLNLLIILVWSVKSCSSCLSFEVNFALKPSNSKY